MIIQILLSSFVFFNFGKLFKIILSLAAGFVKDPRVCN
jgi:hypothetical protein